MARLADLRRPGVAALCILARDGFKGPPEAIAEMAPGQRPPLCRVNRGAADTVRDWLCQVRFRPAAGRLG